MTVIALFHLVWLLLLPSGAILLGGAVMASQRRARRFAVGLGLLLLSLPAVFFCSQMWPVDFLVPGTEVRVTVTGGAYTVSLVQRPGVDFYDSYLEMRRADGKITRLMIDCDDSKLWGLRTKAQGTRTDFVTGSGVVVASVDFSKGTLSGSIDRKLYKLNELNFDRAWSNGG